MSLILSILKILLIIYISINIFVCVTTIMLVFKLMSNTGCTLKDAILAIKLWFEEIKQNGL